MDQKWGVDEVSPTLHSTTAFGAGASGTGATSISGASTSATSGASSGESISSTSETGQERTTRMNTTAAGRSQHSQNHADSSNINSADVMQQIKGNLGPMNTSSGQTGSSTISPSGTNHQNDALNQLSSHDVQQKEPSLTPDNHFPIQDTTEPSSEQQPSGRTSRSDHNPVSGGAPENTTTEGLHQSMGNTGSINTSSGQTGSSTVSPSGTNHQNEALNQLSRQDVQNKEPNLTSQTPSKETEKPLTKRGGRPKKKTD